MTTAIEIIRPRTASELGDEVRALDTPIACCALPWCPRPVPEGARLCSEHGAAAAPQEPRLRARPMTDADLGAWLSAAGATARYWASRYEGMAAVHTGTRVLGDLSARAERYAHIALLVDVLFAVTRIAPRDVMVSKVDEGDFLQRLHLGGARVAASLGTFALDRRGRDR